MSPEHGGCNAAYRHRLPSTRDLDLFLAIYIVQGHVFLDGNKRAGAAAMLTFLEANGISVPFVPEALAALMIDLQKRCEAGEGASRLILDVAASLSRRRVSRKRP